MKHFQWYSTDVCHDDAKMIIGRSFYEGYPFAALKTGSELTIIEGAIYNRSDSEVETELEEIFQTGSSSLNLLNRVKKFLLSTYGEFIIVKYDTEMKKCLIFNDALGRLPVYYSSPTNQSSQRIVISREVKFLIPFLEKPCLDRWSVAEYLLFGFPLGEKTLWANIRRLPPATVLLIDIEKNEFLLKTVLSWNMDTPEEQGHTESRVKEQADSLVKVFLGSLKHITQEFSDDYAHIVSLSGGLDSRATLAGLLETGVDLTACSFPSGENRIARKLAKALNVKYEIVSPSFEISDGEYVKLTDGMLSLELRHVVQYLYAIKAKSGNKAILHTGDGGDKTLAPLSVGSDISTTDDLLQCIMQTDRIFNLDEIGLLLNIKEKALKEHLQEHLAAYPEETLEGKFIHFRVFERGFKWLFVGEDRNRLFLWSITPFYYAPFFKASIELSQRLKKHYLLYKSFLSGLNPLLIRIQYYDRLVPLSIPDWLLKLYLGLFEWLKRNFHEPGTASPLKLPSARSARKEKDEMKKLTLQYLSRRKVFNFLESAGVNAILEKEKNKTKLDTLASFVVYCSSY